MKFNINSLDFLSGLKTIIGLAVTALPALLSTFGYMVTGEEVQMVGDNIVTLVGSAITLYGLIIKGLKRLGIIEA